METISQATGSASEHGAVISSRFSSAGTDVPFDAWRALLAVVLDCTLPKIFICENFEANLLVRHFGAFLLCQSFTEGGRYRRSESRLAWDDLDHIVVSCLLRGEILMGGAIKRLRPGDVTVLDLSSPADFAMAAAEAMHIIVPRTALPTTVASVAPMPHRVFRRNTAMAIFIRGVIESLSRASPDLNAVEVMALGASVPELLGWCLATTEVASSAATKGDLGKRLRRYIEENLNRRDLTSSRLAREVGVSRSQLYRQFETSGGVETYIRRRRLRRCLQALSDPRRANLRIGEIAYEMGFADEAHFSRLFRQTFGQSPRDMRSSTRQRESQSFAGATVYVGDASFAEWLLALGMA